MRLWLLDKAANWLELTGDAVSLPFHLASRWCAEEWRRHAR